MKSCRAEKEEERAEKEERARLYWLESINCYKGGSKGDPPSYGPITIIEHFEQIHLRNLVLVLEILYSGPCDSVFKKFRMFEEDSYNLQN